jgi:hypothetical protein
MTTKHGGSPIKTGNSGSKAIAPGGDPGVGKHEQAKGTEHVSTVPPDAGKHDPNFGHKIKD